MQGHNLPLGIAVLVLILASISPASSQNQQATFNIGGAGGAGKKPSSGGGAGAGGGDSFDQFIAKNVEHFAVTEQIYTSKAKSAGGKVLDAELSAAEAGMVRYVVSSDGKGNFKTITDAIKAVPEKNKKRTILDIKPGTYKYLGRSQ